MIVLEEDFWKYVLVVTATLTLTGIGFMAYKYEVKSQACKDKGGALVELPDGYACVKLERIELK